jgi:WD repeat and SOF domain-containing protein 1
VGFSDFVRFVVLQKYGGIYTDADVLWLRDAWAFRGHEFAYRWSYLPQYNTAVMSLERNSSIGAELIKSALASSLHNRSLSFEAFHPHRLAAYCREKTLQWDMLPSALFDPLWLHYDLVTRHQSKGHGLLVAIPPEPEPVVADQAAVEAGERAGEGVGAAAAAVATFPFEHFDDFFVDKQIAHTMPSFIDNFFRGSFAYHWHNRWDNAVEEGSYFLAFENYFRQQMDQTVG